MQQALDNVLTRCAGLRERERLTILTDAAAERSVVGAFRAAAETRGAETVVIDMAPVRLPGQEPPAAAAAAMSRSDVILELTSKFIGSSQARVPACNAG